jgi:hypothetical protein
LLFLQKFQEIEAAGSDILLKADEATLTTHQAELSRRGTR